jgi:hypothetical protein
MKTLLIRLSVFVAISAGAFAFFSRGPDFPVEWSREVPSKEAVSALLPALRDTRNFPIFHHALKGVALFENGKPVETYDRITPGMTAVFGIEPKAKEWKRFEIRAEVLPPKAGEALRFRLLEESTGKTTRVVDGFEWWVGVRAATEEEAKHGNLSTVFGGASAMTKNARARFFARFAPKILMNQLYQIDLVRLANFTENREDSARESPHVYQ